MFSLYLYRNQKKSMKAKNFTYIVVLQNSDNERTALVYNGTFNQVFEKAKIACPSGYFILEIKVA
jgi:hypothetical protein